MSCQNLFSLNDRKQCSAVTIICSVFKQEKILLHEIASNRNVCQNVKDTKKKEFYDPLILREKKLF